MPKHEDDLIIPAKEGTLAILKTAAENRVKRVVMVSSLKPILLELVVTRKLKIDKA